MSLIGWWSTPVHLDLYFSTHLIVTGLSCMQSPLAMLICSKCPGWNSINYSYMAAQCVQWLSWLVNESVCHCLKYVVQIPYQILVLKKWLEVLTDRRHRLSSLLLLTPLSQSTRPDISTECKLECGWDVSCGKHFASSLPTFVCTKILFCECCIWKLAGSYSLTKSCKMEDGIFLLM